MSTSEVIGRIDFIGFNGQVSESVEYTNAQQFIRDIRSENDIGSPMSIYLYRDAAGNTIPLDFLRELNPVQVSVHKIDSPHLSQEHQVKSKMLHVLRVDPGKAPYEKEIEPGLASLQREVGGDIEVHAPFYDPVVIVCNEEGKLNGLPLNRTLRDDNGRIYDVIAGAFIVASVTGENISSLNADLTAKYLAHFKTLEAFRQVNGKIIVTPMWDIDSLSTDAARRSGERNAVRDDRAGGDKDKGERA